MKEANAELSKEKNELPKHEVTLQDLEIELESEMEFGPNVGGPRRDIGGPN